MAILSDYEEESTLPTASTSTNVSFPFSADFNPSEPLGFLESVFSFVAQKSDFLSNEDVEKDVLAVLRSVVKAREQSRKAELAKKVEASQPVKKPEADVVAVKKKEEVKMAEDVKEEDVTGHRGLISL